MHIDHINIKAGGELLRQLRSFYCKVLDLQEGFRPEFSSGGHWLYAGDSPLIHLSDSGVAERGPDGGHLDHVAFRATGLGAMKVKLESLGIAYRANFIPELEMTQLFIEDPAGTGVEINFSGES